MLQICALGVNADSEASTAILEEDVDFVFLTKLSSKNLYNRSVLSFSVFMEYLSTSTLKRPQDARKCLIRQSFGIKTPCKTVILTIFVYSQFPS